MIVGASAAGLASVLAAGAAKGVVSQSPPDGLYRVDDAATIMAAARAIIEEDHIGVLVTVDEQGMPRARPVGAKAPGEDWALWVSTRRGSRKTRQIAANPKAALHFGFDDTPNGHENAFYASFRGRPRLSPTTTSSASTAPARNTAVCGPIIRTTWR